MRTASALPALLLAALLALPAAARQSDAGSAVTGPMAGAISMRSAKVWAQLPKVPASGLPVWIEFQALGADGSVSGELRRTPAQPLSAERRSGVWLLEGLEPGTRYRYRLRWRDGARLQASAPQQLGTQPLWQWRTDPPPLRILASSCAYTDDPASDRPGPRYGQSPAIFEAMARRQPDLTLWLGDSVYLRETDFDDRASMARRYDQWRATPELQPLLRTGSHLATWDDHDYGPNDSNSSYVGKSLSLDVFRAYWANPGYGLPDLPGVFTQQLFGDVEVFLLDNRWYRDSDKLLDDERAMLGAGQLRWLKNALLASTATFKLIASGSQTLNLNNRFEGWNNFPRESGAFLDWLDRQRVPGVVLLSGDRHFSVLLRQQRPGNYPLHELTCSPSTSRAYANPEADLRDNDRIVSGTVVLQNNFCEIEVEGQRGQRVLKLSVADREGRRLWEQRLDEAQLRAPPR